MDATTGQVREWYVKSGWGVIDSDATPDGCFAHFSTITMPGFRQLSPGQQVEFTFEPTIGLQDGFRFRALEVKPDPSAEMGSDAAVASQQNADGAYSSTLSITWDEPERPEQE